MRGSLPLFLQTNPNLISGADRLRHTAPDSISHNPIRPELGTADLMFCKSTAFTQKPLHRHILSVLCIRDKRTILFHFFSPSRHIRPIRRPAISTLISTFYKNPADARLFRTRRVSTYFSFLIVPGLFLSPAAPDPVSTYLLFLIVSKFTCPRGLSYGIPGPLFFSRQRIHIFFEHPSPLLIIIKLSPACASRRKQHRIAFSCQACTEFYSLFQRI